MAASVQVSTPCATTSRPCAWARWMTSAASASGPSGSPTPRTYRELSLTASSGSDSAPRVEKKLVRSSTARATPASRRSASSGTASAPSSRTVASVVSRPSVPCGRPDSCDRPRDERGEADRAQLAGADVDPHPAGLAAQAGPGRGLLGGRAQHPLADRHDLAALLGQLQEGRRRQQPEVGVVPAQQRLHRGDGAGLQVDLGLVPELERAVLGAAVQGGQVLDVEAVRGGHVLMVDRRLVPIHGESGWCGPGHRGPVARAAGPTARRAGARRTGPCRAAARPLRRWPRPASRPRCR